MIIDIILQYPSLHQLLHDLHDLVSHQPSRRNAWPVVSDVDLVTRLDKVLFCL